MARKTQRKLDFYEVDDIANIVCTNVNDLEFGYRTVNPLTNGDIFAERFGWEMEKYKLHTDCFVVKENGNFLGIIPLMQISSLYAKANRRTLSKNSNVCGDISLAEFNRSLKKMCAALDKDGKDKSKSKIHFLHQLGQLREIDFQELFLPKASSVCAVIDAAVKEDIAETLRAEKNWKKIKKYRFKVSLSKDTGGIFSDRDTKILMSHGINCLNDLRGASIFSLKNMFLEIFVDELPAKINAAFKEDWERRKDRYFKVIPYIFQTLTAIPVAVFCYLYKYTLLYNTKITILIIGLTALWAIAMLSAIYGAIRAVRRRRTKRPGYRYFTKSVLTTFIVIAVVSLFSIGSATLFYERYDGYNDTYYYREIGEDEIAIAGLRNPDIKTLSIPESIRGKTVTEIDLYAFYKDEFSSVTIPKTIKNIDKGAFYKCSNMSAITNYSAITEIKPKTFGDCFSLKNLNFLPETVLKIGNNAFKNNIALTEISLPGRVTDIGKNAFKNCEKVLRVSMGGNIKNIGNSAFEGLTYCTIIECSPVAATDSIGRKAFANCSSLVSVNLVQNAKSVGAKAFYKCSSLDNVIIGNNTNYIGKKVFYDCERLTALSVPFIGKNEDKSNKSKYLFNEKVPISKISITGNTEVKAKAFKKNSTLTVVYLSDGVSEIGKSAFEECDYLSEVKLPSALTEIKDYVFKNCVKLKTVTGIDKISVFGKSAFEMCDKLNFENLTSRVKSIGDKAFYGCSLIKNVDLTHVNELGNEAFANCTGMESANFYMETIPKGTFKNCNSLSNLSGMEYVKKVGKEAFYKTAISDLHFRNGVLSEIGKNAFYGCAYLYDIVLPDSLQKMGKEAFGGCNNLSKIKTPYLGKTRKSKGYKYLFGKFSGVSEIVLTDADSIGSNAFSGGESKIVSIVLNEGIKEIGNNAFKGLTQISEIKLPSTVTKIKNGAFQNLTKIVNIDIPSGVTNIGKQAFKNCSALIVVTGCTNVKEIGKEAFYGCSKLEEISLNSLEKLGEDSFRNCSQLKALPAMNKLKTISKNAFYNAGIIELKLGDKIEEIEERAFYGCKSLKTVTFPAKLRKIDNYAFADCDSIEEVDLSGTLVKATGRGVFQKCNNLISLKLRSDTKIIAKELVLDCEKLTEFAIPSSVTEIRKKAFSNTGLKSILLPAGLEKIGKEAFSDCFNLESILIPDSVKTIKKNAFADCAKLTKVTAPFMGKSANNFLTGTKYVFGKSNNLSIIKVTKMKKIRSNTFKSCSKLGTLVLSNTKKISEKAFDDCSSLNYVYVPKSLVNDIKNEKYSVKSTDEYRE